MRSHAVGPLRNELLTALHRSMQERDVNSSCGIMRRLLSETDYLAFANIESTSSSSSNFSNGSPSHFSHHQEAKLKPSLAQSAAHSLLDAGSVSLRDSPDSLRPASRAVLAHLSNQFGQWKLALRFAESMTHRPPSSLFVAQLVHGANWRAVNAVRQQRRWDWDVPTVLDRLQRRGAWQDALTVAVQSEGGGGDGGRRNADHSRRTTDRYTLGVLVPHLVDRGAWMQSMRLLQRGLSQGFLVDTPLVSEMVRKLSQSPHWEGSLRVLGLLDRVDALPHSYHDVEPQHSSSSPMSLPDALNDMVVRCPSWVGGLALFQRLRRSPAPPSAKAVAALLAKCDAVCAWSAATQVFEIAVKEEMVDPIRDGATCAAVVRSYYAASQWQRAVEALSWMSHAADAAVAAGMSHLVELCERSGQWDAALQVGASMLSSHSSSQHAALSSSSSSNLIGADTLLSLLFASSTGHQWEQSLALFDLWMQREPSAPHPLAACAVVRACYATDQWQPALQFYHRVLSAQPLIVIPPLLNTLTMKVCVKAKRWHDALSLLQLMQEQGLPQDNHSQKLGMWASAMIGAWSTSLRHYQAIPQDQRTLHDGVVVRTSTAFAGPVAAALVMRQLSK